MKLFTHARNFFINFCSSTNIHGFIYISQPKRWKIEKIFWILLITFSLTITFTLIYKQLLEHQNNPTVIYTDQNVVPVTETLFLSITMAPGLIFKSPEVVGIEYEAIKQQLINNKIKIKNLSMNELKRMQIASLIARDGFMSQFNVTIPTDDFVERLRNDFPDVLVPMTQEGFSNVARFVQANWTNFYAINVTEVLCPTGLCYTFNFPSNLSEIFKLNLLSKDFKYEKNILVTDRPYRGIRMKKSLIYPVNSPLKGYGLKIKFQDIFQPTKKSAIGKANGHHNIMEHSLPKSPNNGLPLLFHSPYEIVSKNLKYYHTLYNYDTKILITPKIKVCEESIILMHIDERQCCLKSECHLKYFNIYNRVNCEHECLANLTLSSCNCVQFFMVRNESTRICGVIDEKCFWNVENEFLNMKSSCNCYELCNRIEYEVDVSLKRTFSHYSFTYHSIVFIESGIDKIFPTSRRKQQTFVGLFSFIGGFLGLFAGFSVLSAFEIFYFLMLSPMLKMLRTNDNRVYAFNDEHIKISFMTKMKNYCYDFFINSSIHGFNHIANIKETKVGRLLWISLFILSMLGSYFMIIQAYKSLQLDHITLTFEGRMINADEIPFPAITFTNKFLMRSIVFEDHGRMNYLKQYKGINASRKFEKEMKVMQRFFNANNLFHQVYALICQVTLASLARNFNFNFRTTSDFVNFIKTFENKTNWDELQNSTWNTVNIPPFTETVTFKGIAQTFNIIEDEKLLNFKNLISDFHYKYKTNLLASFPWTSTAGDLKGLKISIKELDRKDKGLCGKYYFAVHKSTEMPWGLNFFEYRYQASYEVLIIPEIVKADDDLRTMTIKHRKCYFDEERNLKYFKIYTQKNCEMECLSHVIYEICKCVSFHYPRNKTMKICDYKRTVDCIEVREKTFKSENHDHLYKQEKVCKCYPTCNSITYNYKINEIYTQLDFKKNVRDTTLTFRYKDGEFLSLLRYRPYKLVDFLSYVGGILGLFAGISVLSIVEIFYYFTLRLANDFMKIFK